MSDPGYGRVQVAEPLAHLSHIHRYDGASPLKEVDHEPPMGVLDQSDLHAQGIYCSQFIPGAGDPDALGSCTANATTVHLSDLLPEAAFLKAAGVQSYADTVGGETFSIRFYNACTDQTGQSGTEWPPTDCGSSGPYIYSEAKAQGLVTSQRIAQHAQDVVSLLQSGTVLCGQPFLKAWESPDANGFIDGDGSLSTLTHMLTGGVAGGHETCWSSIEKLAFDGLGRVNPAGTVIRARNSWSASWGDHGSYRFHLSTFVALSHWCDFRQLGAAA